MSRPVIIYHANCLDGFGAAYAAWRIFGDEADYLPAKHGEAPPDCQGRKVYIVDFSYKRPLLKQLCSEAAEVIIIDHHISAQEDLAGLELEHDNLQVHFDMEHSGAVLTWRYFHSEPEPMLLRHVEDRDLWRFEAAGSNDTNAALMSYPFEFALWHEVVESAQRLEQLQREGEAINRYRRQLIEDYKAKAAIGRVAGYEVPVVNCPHAIASDLLGELAEGHPFAAGYSDNGSKRSWSLRSSRNGGADVAKVASLFGGGGHKNAAGFGTPLPASHLVVEPDQG